MKSFKQFRSRSRKGKTQQQEQPDNQKLLAQIIKGHEMGRNHIILKQSKTTTPGETQTQKQTNYRIQYGSDLKDDNQENLDEDDEEPKKSPDTLYNKTKPEAQQIPCLQPNLKNRKDLNIYSFTKNIDYTNITQHQISKFLQEKKDSPVKKRIGSKKKSLNLKNAEKENLQKMDYIKIDKVKKEDHLGLRTDPRNRKSDLYLWSKKTHQRKLSPNNINNTVQVLNMSKSYNNNSINQSNQNMNENFSLKLSKVQDHGLKKKFSQSNLSSNTRQRSNSPTKNGAQTDRASLTVKNSNFNTFAYNHSSIMTSRAGSKQKNENPNEAALKRLSQQYSNTTARAEHFKIAVSKKTVSRNLNSMSKSIKSPLTTQKSINSNNEHRTSQISSNQVLQDSPEYLSSKKRISRNSIKLSQGTGTQEKFISDCKGNAMSRNQNVLPTPKSRDKHMAHTVQINLDDNILQHDLTKKNTAEVKKENNPFEFNHQIISSGGQSSCQEEKLTQQGSGNQSTENQQQEIRKTTNSNDKSDNSKLDQLTYEKHLIWKQSQIENISLDVTEKRSFKASMKGLNMMTFVEKCPDVKVNDIQSIQRRSSVKFEQKTGSTTQEDNMIPGERLSTILSEEFQRVSMDAYKTLALNEKQSSTVGPRRLSRTKRGSNVSYNELTESRKTANFTNQSLTYNDDDDIDEFSKEARERDAEEKRVTQYLGSQQQFNFDGVKKIEDTALNSAVTMGDIHKDIGLTQHTRSSILSPAFAVKDFDSSLIVKVSNEKTIAQKNNLELPKQVSHQYDICNTTPKKTKPIYQEIVDLSSNTSIISIDFKIDFESLYEQQDLLLNMKEIIEIRTSAIQTYKLRNSQDFSMDSKQAIEGLFVEERQKIKQLCQDWWDSTQEDVSLHKAGQIYQQQVQQEVARGTIDISEGLSCNEKDFLILHHEQRSICMRKCAVLQTSVIGMIAFFSMLQREGSSENSIKQDLELRQRLSQLLKMIYDQSMLCLSFIIGKLAQYENVTKDRNSIEHKLYQIYNDYIHILFINKKIQTENDYQIYNQKNGKKLFIQRPDSAYITNEENRDYQLNQLSQRLQENSLKIINAEMEIQKNSQKYGNLNLLKILQDVSKNAGKMDFQTAKNKIYEGISQSDVMPNQITTTDETVDVDDLSLQDNKSQIESNPIQYNTEQNSYESNTVFDQENIAPANAMKSQISQQYGAHLIKTFKDASDQIIQEESREESMSVSIINSSKVRDDYFSNSKHGSALFNSYKKQNRHRNLKFTPSKGSDKVFDMTENDDSEVRKRKNTVSSIDGSIHSNQWSRDITLQIEEHEKQNPDIIRVQSLSQIEKAPREPYLPDIKSTYKYTVVLDLDETLVHCTPYDKLDKDDFQIGNEQELVVYKRPGLHEFLLEISKYFEVVVFTAGGQAYAKKIVSQCLELSSDSNLIDHILFWDHVTIISDKQAFKLQQRLSLFYSSLDESYVLSSNNRKYSQLKNVEVEDVATLPERTKSDLKLSEFTMSKDSVDSTEVDKCYVKDLSKLGRDLSKIIIVDNLPENYALQLNNGICIREYRVDQILDDKDKKKEPDRALNQLSSMLRDIYQEAEKLEISGINVDLRDILQTKLKEYRAQRENYYFV